MLQTSRKFYSKAEVAEILGVSLATVNRRLAEGTLPSKKFGRRVLIVREYVDALSNQAAV